MRILVIDCRDSFVHNLSSLLEDSGADVIVMPEDSAPTDPYESGFDALVVSPGPGRPSPRRGSWQSMEGSIGRIPVLGVCLGHQTLCAISGMDIIHGRQPMHGKIVRIRHDGTGLMTGLRNGFEAVRYNSLIADPSTVKSCIRIDATDENGDIMAVSRTDVPAFGLQFHPESFMTECGKKMMLTFLEKVER